MENNLIKYKKILFVLLLIFSTTFLITAIYFAGQQKQITRSKASEISPTQVQIFISPSPTPTSYHMILFTPTPPPTLNYPACKQIDVKSIKLNGVGNILLTSFYFNGNQPDGGYKLRVDAYYSPDLVKWAALNPMTGNGWYGGNASGYHVLYAKSINSGNYYVIASMYAFKDINNNNQFDPNLETRKICSGNPAVKDNGPGCGLCLMKVSIP
ncbi:MAG: hypothetical protein QHH09_02560 [Microgenomates group bacterium]|nr:hypothetical protein [Microgenomates group bacterium]